MKPQDSTPPTHVSSQTQESESANESLESLLARLETSAVQKEDTTFNREELKDIITKLEQDIADGNWIKADYAKTDFKMMPVLVEQANRKYPEMKLKYAMTPQDFALSVKEAVENGVEASRYIVNTKERGIHFAVIDQRTIDDKTSLIFFEPTTLNNMNPAMLALRTQMAIESYQLPHCHFSMVEMDIQRSSSECGMFSLALAKKLHIESEKLTRMHKDNINGVLCKKDSALSSDKLDTYLPPSFYKHTQSKRRLKEYMQSNPEAGNEKVNKKGETLPERFDKSLVTTQEKTVSVSQHRKRVTEYKSIMM
ncbi:YopJ/AvrA family T3SS effector serine/threonine acetyltransferase [Bartonella refiksaydamii]|uniref:YopJ/AvrA family T3SS effector serine/threonine acetyltransferase n=1 Tax=Bartonella refiksaydamii TaxID=2654951 RepID=UPI0012EC355F|nr:YopJ/AvrA family T3SS effector serine/threonine acetyltransferase [Bartonella refiksaydamii]